MARHLHLVAYDVSCPGRLQRTLAAVKPWRASGQKSVAECFLSPAERDRLCGELAARIDEAEDRLHIVRLDPRMKARLFGVARQHDGRAFQVV
jgi:CRISPR-associated protein Cas2